MGHVRYSTAVGSTRENAQPLVLSYIKGTLALAHNGNLIKTPELKRELNQNEANLHTTTESEVIEKIERIIFGKDVTSMYYWLDEFERIRGFGDTEDECRREAEEQNCQEYTIQK